MRSRPFFVVLTVSLALLPIYFFNLPMELVPRPSHQVINYFYDRRTYIGIHSVVASSNNSSSEKEVHLGNVRNLKGEEDLYRDDGGRNREMNVHHLHDSKLANANVNQFSSNPPSPTSPSQFSSNPPSPTSPSQLSSNPPSTSPSQNLYQLTNEQKKSIAQKKPKQLLPRLTSIPQYLMSQVNSRLSALGLNSNGRKQSQEQLKQSHVAASKAKHKLAKRSSTLSRKQKVKMMMKVRLRQRLQMKLLPINVNCTDDTCKKLKEMRERYYYETCSKEARKDYEVKPCRCSLLDGKKRGRYALLSLPGSGNTWVRGLLEKATGVCTGSMWCDASLRAKHFCMEGVRSTSVLVVKNHDTHLRWVGVKLGDGESVNNKPDFIGGILIHRNPFRATIAEWNRDAGVILTANVTDTPPQTKTKKAVPHPPKKTKTQKVVPHPQAVFNDAIKTETKKAVRMLHHNVTSDSLNATKNNHLSYFGKEMFGNNVGWNETVYLQAEKWKRMIEHYIINNRVQPILVVKYEDLKTDPVTQVKRMLAFLRYPYKDKEVEERLEGGFFHFYRNHTDTFEHYTPEQTAHMNNVITSVIDRLKQENITNFIPLEPYLRL